MEQTVKQIIVRRDKISEEDADTLIAAFKGELQDLLDENAYLQQAEDLLEDYFGLEPDYLDEFTD